MARDAIITKEMLAFAIEAAVSEALNNRIPLAAIRTVLRHQLGTFTVVETMSHKLTPKDLVDLINNAYPLSKYSRVHLKPPTRPEVKNK